MARIRVITRVQSTSSGALGVLLFIGGPIVGAIGYAIYLNSYAVGWVVLAAIAGAAWLLGCALMWTGREYIHDATVTSDDAPPPPAPNPRGTRVWED